MKKYLIVLIVIFSINLNAQMSKKAITESLNRIYENYMREITVINDKLKNKYEPKFLKATTDKEKQALNKEYQKDYDFYLPEAEKLQAQKIKELKILIKKIETENPLIGKKKISDSSGTISKEPYKEIPDFGRMPNKETDELRKAFINNFRSDYFDLNKTVETDLRIIVDSDGSLKNITATGSNEEFNYVAIITVYSLGKKLTPSESNGYYMLKSYRLPIAINFD
ncbi:hypothetical protein FY557_02110 [Chryseobacterium sp. SN22]|uniref:hypothetical protein n=1 Tax=Chryseobacterium sp. SN22 TaxID=2606431 RepID=UPI0011EE0DA7|nr:hypothetical protein [Chryseobacterium sp. SN22]KAA0130540.1 hypothetical protein FY557_02110 [Chryseobacterium sp. SN22]